jgi:hypothetical protein
VAGGLGAREITVNQFIVLVAAQQNVAQGNYRTGRPNGGPDELEGLRSINDLLDESRVHRTGLGGPADPNSAADRPDPPPQGPIWSTVAV